MFLKGLLSFKEIGLTSFLLIQPLENFKNLCFLFSTNEV